MKSGINKKSNEKANINLDFFSSLCMKINKLEQSIFIPKISKFDPKKKSEGDSFMNDHNASSIVFDKQNNFENLYLKCI